MLTIYGGCPKLLVRCLINFTLTNFVCGGDTAMKFHNGGWMPKKNHGIFSPGRVFETEREEDSVTLVTMADMSLQGVSLTIKVTAPVPEVIRVQVEHYKGGQWKNAPAFELNLPEHPQKMQVEETEEMVTVHSGHLSLIIDKVNWSMRYERDGKLLTKSEPRDMAYIKTDWQGSYYSYDSEGAYMRQQLKLSVGELIYGLGERFTPFVKNGQTVDIWNEDGGTSTEQSYKNIPFYVSNKGYGVFVNHTEKVSFEVGSEFVTKAAFSVPGESLDYFLIDGPTMKEVLMRYTDLTGKPGLPPEWTFGLWLSTSFVTRYDEETVLGFIEGMEERGIPLKVFHFDCLWMKLLHWTDFIWNSDIFPDPKGMIEKIHAKGIKVCVWINPYIAQRSALFDEGMEKGYFLKRQNGDVWQWDMWQPGLAIIDFTNPAACEWYAGKLKMLMEMGVDCFKTDFGERIPTDAVYFNGADPEKMHNYYSYLYNKLVYNTIEEMKGKGEAVLFARSGTAGGQKFPVHWGGDCSANYESMSESLRGGLSLTSSGYGFWSHDIGGFEDTSTPDVYMRWAAFGLLSTHSRLHGSSSYRVPWNYGEEAVTALRFFTRLKMSLMPYIYANAVQTSRTGVPLMRSMVMEFTEDYNCGYLERQYMLGEHMLVAPIFNEEGIGSFYLPEGKWTDYLTGECFTGGRWYEKQYDYESIPLLVRENSIIAKGARDDAPDYEYADGVEFRVYEIKTTAQSTLYQKARETASCTVSREGNVLTVDVVNEKPCTVRLVNTNKVSLSAKETQSDDVEMQQDGADCVLMIKSGGGHISVRME